MSTQDIGDSAPQHNPDPLPWSQAEHIKALRRDNEYLRGKIQDDTDLIHRLLGALERCVEELEDAETGFHGPQSRTGLAIKAAQKRLGL